MDIRSDINRSNANRLRPFLTVLQQIGLGITRWFIGFFTLTEEDRLAAGIYLGNKERVR